MGSHKQHSQGALRQQQITAAFAVKAERQASYGGLNFHGSTQVVGAAVAYSTASQISSESMRPPGRLLAHAQSMTQQGAAAIAAGMGALAINTGQTQDVSMSQDGASFLQRADSLPQHLRVDVSQRLSSQDNMCTPDYATPQDQQFHVDYDLAARPDQESRSPAGSPAPVRNIKRTRRLAGLDEGAEVSSQPSQSTEGPEPSGPSMSGQTSSSQQGFTLPPVPSRPKSRFFRPQSPASYKNPFLSGYDADQVYGMDPRHPRPCPQLTRLHVEFNDIKELGAGSFSRVYRATHRIDGCCYAIKRTKHPADSVEVHNRWLQEVQALSAAQAHPNIIRYFNAWAEPDMSGDHLYIQIELAGETLADVLAAHKKALNEPVLVGLMKQMASALAHLHARGIVHLDVKPDNIFRSGGDGAYKLGDFGLATLSSGRWRVAEGDSRYLAPELLQGDVRHLDKVDMFALGATLYELAGGSPLPRDASVWGRIKGRRPGETVPPWPGISNSFKCLIMKLLSEDPAARPSAAALAEAPLGSKAPLAMVPTSSGGCGSGGAAKSPSPSPMT